MIKLYKYVPYDHNTDDLLRQQGVEIITRSIEFEKIGVILPFDRSNLRLGLYAGWSLGLKYHPNCSTSPLKVELNKLVLETVGLFLE